MRPLPDPALLVSSPAGGAAVLQALAGRLRAIGLTSERVWRVNAMAATGLDPIRMTILRWHLRRERDASALAMRLFLYRDALTLDEARAVLGDALDPTRALELGLLARAGEGTVRSAWLLALVEELFILHDDLRHGEDAVMGLSQTTSKLCQAAFPASRVGRVLDVGCGAGTLALLCASRADRVVGIDLNARAVTLSRANAALNGIDNAEFRAGDLFAPVAGETFDLVVSQPPFVARPGGEAAGVTLRGGARGDELPLRLLRELPPHLCPGGRAVLLVEWPVVEGDPVARRVRAELPQRDVSLLQLEAPGPSLDELCAGYAATELESLGPAFEAGFGARRDHLDAMGVQALEVAITVVGRTTGGPGWTSTLGIRPLHEVDLDCGRIDALVAARELVERGLDALLAATLRAPEGLRFTDEGEKVVGTLGPRALLPPVRTTRAVVELIAAVHGADTVAEVVTRLAVERGIEARAAAADVAPAIRNALLYGLLEVAPAGGDGTTNR